jgi:hypothetical protein
MSFFEPQSRVPHLTLARPRSQRSETAGSIGLRASTSLLSAFHERERKRVRARHVCPAYAAGLILALLDRSDININARRCGEVRESGLTGVTRNHVCPRWHRGFESPPLRHRVLSYRGRLGYILPESFRARRPNRPRVRINCPPSSLSGLYASFP